MKKLRFIAIALTAALLMVGAVSLVGAQENTGSTCPDGVLNNSCNSELAQLCVSFIARWQAAGGESSNISIPDWCVTDSLPTTESNANACTDGVLEGKCESGWEWTCGYYLQQWEAAGGWYGTYTVPDWCDPDSLLPRKPEVITEPQGGCYTNSYVSFYYSGISTSVITEYSTTDCTGAALAYPTKYGVDAADLSAAQNVCTTLVPISPSVWKPAIYSYNSPDSLWFCTINTPS